MGAELDDESAYRKYIWLQEQATYNNGDGYNLIVVAAVANRIVLKALITSFLNVIFRKALTTALCGPLRRN